MSHATEQLLECCCYFWRSVAKFQDKNPLAPDQMTCHHLVITACAMCFLFHSNILFLPSEGFSLSMLEKVWINYHSYLLLLYVTGYLYL